MKFQRILPLALLTAIVLPAAAQESLFDDADNWSVAGDVGGFESTTDGTVLNIRNGSATLNGVDFRDGTVSFEMRLTDSPGFVGLQFRADTANAEHVYFRPHRSGEWDAIQYQPIMNGSTTWQTHVGEGYSANADLHTRHWIQVRLVVLDDRADLYLGSHSEPVMRLILERGVTHGALAIVSYYRGGGPAGEMSGSFRNFTVEPGVGMVTDRPEREYNTDGMITTWQVSQPFAVSTSPVRQLPPSSNMGGQVIEAELRGLVNLNRHFWRVSGADRSGVVASVSLEASRAQTVGLQLSYSDDVTVFFNGAPLYSGVNDWQTRYPYYLGVVSPESLSETVYLPLRSGSNELSLVVSEGQAFGWGFVARLTDADGVEVSLP